VLPYQIYETTKRLRDNEYRSIRSLCVSGPRPAAKKNRHSQPIHLPGRAGLALRGLNRSTSLAVRDWRFEASTASPRLLGGEPLGARGKNFNRLLRRLMGLGCVQWVGAGGRYRVTKLGRVARSLGVRR
jgi:hypothetical protein